MYTLAPSSLKTHFNIILPPTSRHPKRYEVFHVFRLKCTYEYMSISMCMLHVRSSLFPITLITTKILIMQVSPNCHYLTTSLLGPNILPSSPYKHRLVTNYRRFATFRQNLICTMLHGVTSHKRLFLTVNALRPSNLTLTLCSSFRAEVFEISFLRRDTAFTAG